MKSVSTRIAFVFVCAFAFVAVARAEQIDNPAYKKWSAYKPGTWVKHKTTADMAGQKTENEMTTKLVEVTPDKAVIEIAMSMTVGGQKMDMPAQKQEVPAKIEKPAAPAADAPKADVKEGEEEVTVAGKTFKCKTTETTMKQGNNTTKSKVWMSDDVPQGMVKMQSSTEGDMKMSSNMELVAFEITK